MQKEFERSALKKYVYPMGGGVCIFLAFETYNILPLLFLLPFFLNGMRQLPLKNKLLGYWLMAIVTNVCGYHWISTVARDYGGMPGFAAWGLVLFFSVFNNLNFLLWAYLERFFGEKSNPFIIAGLFCVAEQLNPQVFPWYFGTSLDSALILYQTADLFGVVGLSFVAMTLIHIPWWVWQNRQTLFRENRALFTAQAAFLTFIVVYGWWALAKYDNQPGAVKKTVGVTLVQSNTSMEKFYGARLSYAEREEEFQNIVRISEKAISESPTKIDLLVWPEGSVHFPILNSPQIYQAIRDLARRQEVFLTAGSVEIGGKRASGRRIYYNTQFYLNPQGEIIGKYHKIVLLAFGEYIPFLETFPIIEKWLPSTISHFTRGREKPVFAIHEKMHWLPLICYEDIIVGFIQGFEHRQADFMVNITNDGWFGRSDASHLHKQMARPRTVEYRKPIVRALNTGSSQVIDAAGRTISKETAVYTRDFINVELHVPENAPVTLYARIGNLPIYSLMVLVAVFWLRKKFFSKSSSKT
ncbi:MAG: apolipoprotein N-acyltransferase [bacterium]